MKYIKSVKCKSILNKSGIPGINFGINPYTGCLHKCQYCYAVFMKKFSGHTEPWGDFVDIKGNAPEVLERQLKRLKQRYNISFGTVCDAYQPVEKKYGITRECLKKLLPYDHHLSILTKSPLVTRDIDLLACLRHVEVGFTITTLDQRAHRVFEPGASSPLSRFAALKKLSDNKISTWVFVAPVLPFFGDSWGSIKEIMLQARTKGASVVMFDTLNPYPKVWKNVISLVRKHFPDALPAFQKYRSNTVYYNNRLKSKISRIAMENMIPYKIAFACSR